MKFSDIFLLATRMFKARTMRTFLTVLGMSVGIGAILFLVSLGYGLQNTLLEKITTSDSLLTLDVAEQRTEKAFLTQEALDKIKEIPGVNELSPALQVSAQGSMGNLTADLTAVGSNPSYLRFSGIKLENGAYFKDDDEEGIVIAEPVAQIFSKSVDEIIGQELSFAFFLPAENDMENGGGESNTQQFAPDKKFKVIGVVSGEENIIYLNLKNFSSQKISHFSQLKVKCNSDKDLSGVRDQIMEQKFIVSSISEIVDQVNKVFRVIKIILMLFGIIALIVSAIGMFNTMTIALLERTEEIGIMKSIGASDRAISLMFIMESTIMGFLGGLLGIVIGWLEGVVFNYIINLVAAYFGGQKLNLFFIPFWFIMVIIVFAAFVGFLTGVIPARRASRIDPLEALRYK